MITTLLVIIYILLGIIFALVAEIKDRKTKDWWEGSNIYEYAVGVFLWPIGFLFLVKDFLVFLGEKRF